MTSVAKMLREKRSERNYTQTEVADLLNITLRQYINYENDHLPPHEQLLKLNTVFQYDFSIHIYNKDELVSLRKQIADLKRKLNDRKITKRKHAYNR
jgi:transcriptional regulator with XRE-family HTH domain